MGKVILSGVGRNVEAPVTLAPVFADNTWAAIVSACHSGNIPDTWVIGDQKTMTIGSRDFVINIIGKNHDDYTDGSGKAPLTFQLYDLYASRKMRDDTSSNVVSWAGTDMRNTHLPELMGKMPPEVQAGIRMVHKTTVLGNYSDTIIPTEDKIFLLSYDEVLASGSQGTQYEYYASGNSKIKYRDGTAQDWWLRSPYTGNSDTYYFIRANGGNSTATPTSSKYVSCAFCF